MKRILLFLFILSVGVPFGARAQFEKLKDSVVMLFGVVMTADSLQGIPYVSVVIQGSNRGTQTNAEGVFSIVVEKGNLIEFSSIGYKPKIVEIPRNLEGNQHSMIQLMVTDTMYLPATIIRPRPTKEQFDRDFVNVQMPDDLLEIARKNADESKRSVLSKGMPADGREATGVMLKGVSQRAYYSGQAPPQNIFNPFAWNEFIKAWKRGDYKSKK
ncbi:MAG: carboxypeptidase-like regulatory domain-containing protein [Chitinophagaceae bacterium]|nr:MAG: carboxypeptidase-like regulatory domain-containing protein [Chitinophagaceae bacterium]